MLEYKLCVKDSKTHTFDVSLRVDKPSQKICVSLPVWIPGSYLVREFAKHLFALHAQQGGKKLDITQLDKCTWEIDCQEHGEPLEISWKIYALDASVRTAYLDQYRGFLNGTSVFLRPHGLEHEQVRLAIDIEDDSLADWDYACALSEANHVEQDSHVLVVLQAQNYDELVDSPIELGKFWRGQFMVKGVAHEFVVAGSSETFDGERLLDDTRLICEQVMQFWGEENSLPYKRYVFMLYAADHNYGGLEHKASTALICRREDLPRKGETKEAEQTRAGYQDLLTLICHEFFHTWHVKRMRPIELTAYDYTQENYTELLWFFEGVTSYYEYMLVYRAGLLTQEQLLGWMAKDLKSVESMPGRHVQSLAQSSFDAWIKFYRVDENTANSTISYYTKGAMVALCLDLTLRKEGRGTLDDVMRLLWASSSGGGVGEKDILHALENVGGRSYTEEVKAWVHGTDELPVEDCLEHVGIMIKRKPLTIAQKLGVVLQKAGAGLVLRSVLKGSAAERAGMAAGDELIAVNGWRCVDLNEWAIYANLENSAQVLIARDGKVNAMDVKLDVDVLGEAEFVIRDIGIDGDSKNASLRQGWLKC